MFRVDIECGVRGGKETIGGVGYGPSCHVWGLTKVAKSIIAPARPTRLLPPSKALSYGRQFVPSRVVLFVQSVPSRLLHYSPYLHAGLAISV